jgi:hypothetical protein
MTEAQGSRQVSVAAPVWLSVLFLSGLVLLYLGQRVVLKWESVATGVSWLGVTAMVLATAGRFAPLFRARGAHAEIARVLDGLQLLGMLGVLLYFVTTATGTELLGISTKDADHLLTVLSVLWTMLLAVSVSGLVFAELALHPMRDAEHLEVRRVRAAAISGTVLALAASYGSLFVYAASKQEAQADFSYFKTSEPGEATIKLVQKAARPIQVTAFFPEVSEVRKEVASYLHALAAQTENLEVKIVDRYLEPALANEHKVVADGTVVLSQEDGTQNLVLGAAMSKSVRQKLTKFDGEFYAKLLRLLHSRRTAYLTTGHGELNDADRDGDRAEGRTATVLKKLLEQQNYQVRDLGIGQGLANQVPDDADVVLVAGPTMPFAPEELGALERYAAQGGKLLMALDVDAVPTSDFVGSGAVNVDAAAVQGKPATTVPTAANPAPVAPGLSATSTPAAAPSAAGAPEEAAQPNASKHEWLVRLAAVAGATLVPTVLADPSSHVVRRNDPSDRVIMPTNRFSSHASVSTLSRNAARAGVVVMGAAHLLDTETSNGRPTVTVRSFPTAFSDDDRDFVMGAGEQSKVFNLAVALAREIAPAAAGPGKDHAAEDDAAEDDAAKDDAAEDDAAKDDAAEDDAAKDDATPNSDEDTQATTLRTFVIADADVLSDLLMERVVGNQMLLVDAIRWLVGEESLAGELETEEDVRIEHTKQEDVAWFYSTIFGVPAVVLLSGFWTSRRLKRPRTGQKRAAKGAES